MVKRTHCAVGVFKSADSIVLCEMGRGCDDRCCSAGRGVFGQYLDLSEEAKYLRIFLFKGYAHDPASVHTRESIELFLAEVLACTVRKLKYREQGWTSFRASSSNSVERRGGK